MFIHAVMLLKILKTSKAWYSHTLLEVTNKQVSLSKFINLYASLACPHSLSRPKGAHNWPSIFFSHFDCAVMQKRLPLKFLSAFMFDIPSKQSNCTIYAVKSFLKLSGTRHACFKKERYQRNYCPTDLGRRISNVIYIGQAYEQAQLELETGSPSMHRGRLQSWDPPR